MGIKAILLLSGGLDSILAGRVLLEQGVEVEALNFTSPFCNCTPKHFGCSAARQGAEQLGIPVTIRACGEPYLEIMKHPRFGRGSGMNACLDCRIHLFARAKEFMAETQAAFVATGEVLGERPMSQRRDAMHTIERESGLAGLIVRPLSAQHFPPSVPEVQGWVDRRRLLAFQGRGRTPQIQLAEQFGIHDYPCPAGGCLLTDKEIAARFRELLEHQPNFGLSEARLLKVGRHFRFPGGAKLILGRNAGENQVLERARRETDVLLAPRDVAGPTALLQGGISEQELELGSQILAAYIKASQAPLLLKVRDNVSERILEIVPANQPNLAEAFRIGVRAQGFSKRA
jgi:tRNA U34 2-thiouridine synthase MnmA/TrmU